MKCNFRISRARERAFSISRFNVHVKTAIDIVIYKFRLLKEETAREKRINYLKLSFVLLSIYLKPSIDPSLTRGVYIARHTERERARRRRNKRAGECNPSVRQSLSEAGHGLFLRIIWFFYGSGQSVSADKRIKPLPTTAL